MMLETSRPMFCMVRMAVSRPEPEPRTIRCGFPRPSMTPATSECSGLMEATTCNSARAGAPTIKAMRRISQAHSVEEVGGRLRAMMPWLKQNQLVDKSKN